MVKICVLSDSHNDCEEALNAVDREKPDIVIHLGDGVVDLHRIEREHPELKVFGVSGNCDPSQAYPYYQNLKFEEVKVFITHGQKFNVKNDASLFELCCKAMENDADLVLFGHTHHAFVDRKLCMDIMNPGTIGCGRDLSYGIVQIDGKKIKCELKHLDNKGVGKYGR